MIGIDTNILVRYLVQDDVLQSQKATHLLENDCSTNKPAFINAVVLCELVWVLETAYEYNREIIATVLEKILRTKQFHIHEPEIIWQALHGYKNSKVDFADNFINHFNIKHDCEFTMTFDKKAGRLVGFKILQDYK